MLKNNYLKFFCICVQIFIVNWFASACFANDNGEATTAYADALKIILENNNTNLFAKDRKEQQRSINDLTTCLSSIKNKEEKTSTNTLILNWISDGFKNNNNNIFREAHKDLNKKFFKIINKTEKFSFSVDGIIDVLSKNDDYKIYIIPEWIEYIKKNQDQKIFDFLFTKLNKSETLEEYLDIMNFSVRLNDNLNRTIKFTNNLKNRYLNKATFDELSKIDTHLKEYWNDNNFQSTIQNSIVERLFRLDVSDWVKNHGFTWNYAKIHKKNVDQWILKIIKAIQKNPENSEEACKLLKESFLEKGIEERFINSVKIYDKILAEIQDSLQEVFIALNKDYETSPIGYLNSLSETNKNKSIHIISQLFRNYSDTTWTVDLWNLFKAYYQIVDESQKYNYYSVIEKIYDAKPSNQVRKLFLSEIRDNDSIFLPSHKYKIASDIFVNNSIHTSVETDDETKPSVLKFTIDTFLKIDLEQLDNEMFKILKIDSHTIDERQKQIKLSYINQILSKPLKRLCNAFMGIPNIKDNALNIEKDNEELDLLHEMLKIISTLKKNEPRLESLDIQVLFDLSEKIVTQIQKLVNSSDNFSAQVTQMLKVIFRIINILEDDSYLSYLLKLIREDIYGLSSSNIVVVMPEEQLNRSVNIFFKLHDDLINTLTVHKFKEYLKLFYKELYVPLRNIYGFFNKVGVSYYTDFLEHMDIDKELFETIEISQLSVQNFLNAESAISDLIHYYFVKIKLNPWKKIPKYLKVGHNVNLPVFYNILNHKDFIDTWIDYSNNWSTIINWFVQYIEVSNYRIKDANQLGENISYYSKWDFYTFLIVLLDLCEIYEYPFIDDYPFDDIDIKKSIDFGSLVDKNGIPKIVNIKIKKRKQVNGTLRKELCDIYLNTSRLKPEQIFEIVRLTLLLPNRQSNNHFCSSSFDNTGRCKKTLSDYTKQIVTAYNLAKPLLNNDEYRFKCLMEMLKLSYSVKNNEINNTFFNYKDIKKAHISKLSKPQQRRINFEEFVLKKVNDSPESFEEDIRISNKWIGDLLDDFFKSYQSLDTYRKDSIARYIIELLKKIKPNEMISKFNEKDIGSLWFVTEIYNDILAQFIIKENTVNENTKKNMASLTSQILLLNQFFLPHLNGNFSLKGIFQSDKKRNILAIYSLLNIKVKENIFEYIKNKENHSLFISKAYEEKIHLCSLQEIKAFILSHNLVSFQMLEQCFKDFGIIEALIKGKEV